MGLESSKNFPNNRVSNSNGSSSQGAISLRSFSKISYVLAVYLYSFENVQNNVSKILISL